MKKILSDSKSLSITLTVKYFSLAQVSCWVGMQKNCFIVNGTFPNFPYQSHDDDGVEKVPLTSPSSRKCLFGIRRNGNLFGSTNFLLTKSENLKLTSRVREFTDRTAFQKWWMRIELWFNRKSLWIELDPCSHCISQLQSIGCSHL